MFQIKVYNSVWYETSDEFLADRLAYLIRSQGWHKVSIIKL